MLIVVKLERVSPFTSVIGLSKRYLQKVKIMRLLKQPATKELNSVQFLKYNLNFRPVEHLYKSSHVIFSTNCQESTSRTVLPQLSKTKIVSMLIVIRIVA
jgi:hypothetical protein